MQAKTLKFLIADHGVSFDAATIMNALVKTGHVEVFQYASTTGNGVMKSFKRLTVGVLPLARSHSCVLGNRVRSVRMMLARNLCQCGFCCMRSRCSTTESN